MPESRHAAVEQPGILRVPGWERFRWLRAGFSTRQGGRSSSYGPAEQNLGWTAEDDPAVVAANRAAFVQALGGDAGLSLTTVKQVHSGVVRALDGSEGPLMTPDGRAMHEGDGMISGVPGRLLAILTADCVPVLLADPRTHAVGAFHAGWRGTLARIVEHGVRLMEASYGSRPADLIAAVGPCIHACCFEVGEDVQIAFAKEFPYSRELFSGGESSQPQRLDLVEANRRQLLDAGVHPECISVVGQCTACARLPNGRRRFFSYRAERGATGRMLSAIGAVEAS